MTTNYIDNVFGAGGLLAQKFDGYTPREGQLQVVREIEHAIANAEHTLVEAPTGTGKSIAYLVPAIFHATEGTAAIRAARVSDEPAEYEPEREGFDATSEESDFDEEFAGGADRAAPPEIEPVRAIVVTANIALQEQLIMKDLPLLQEVLPQPFTFAIAKGRGNYLCLDRFDDAQAEFLLMGPQGFDAKEQWATINQWAATTKLGDLSELPFEPLTQLRTKMTVSADECIGKVCGRFDDCHAERAKKKLATAQVIVTNYHLFFASLAMQKEFGRGILPPADIVILDEGHKAADVARSFFGFKISLGTVSWATRLLVPPKASKKSPIPPLDPELRARVLEAAEGFFDQLLHFRKSRDYYARLVAPDAAQWRPLHALLLEAKRVYDGAASTNLLAPDRKQEVIKASRKVAIVAEAIRRAMQNPGSGEVDANGVENEVFFIEETGREGSKKAALCSQLVDVSEVLRAELFQSSVRSVIVASATLATKEASKGGFDWLSGELGAEDARELQTPSPFDFERQALLVIPSNLPDPKAKDFSVQVAHVVCEAVEQAKGRTLGLFTSYRGLEAAYDRVQAEFGDRYRVMRQGDAPRTQLIAAFKADVNSVLLGTESFWAGVDVPGESLSCVVIDKIPFPHPEDPVMSALDERLGKAFFKEVSIPRAAIQLRQGFGRLIRAAGDRGVVVICDRRLVDKPYGKMLLASLPFARRSRDIADVGRFLAGRA